MMRYKVSSEELIVVPLWVWCVLHLTNAVANVQWAIHWRRGTIGELPAAIWCHYYFKYADMASN